MRKILLFVALVLTTLATCCGSKKEPPTGTCTAKQALVQVWCVNVNCTGKCNLYEDGKLLGSSSGPEQPFNRREGSSYECKCE